MDPDANITEQVALACELLEAYHADSGRLDDDDAARLCELVLALDEWRRNGGFDPYAGADSQQAKSLLFRAKTAALRGGHLRVFSAAVAGLPEGYLYVQEHDGAERPFECGIAPDGSVSS